MFDIFDLGKHAEMVIGENEKSILMASFDHIDEPENTTVAMIRLAKEKVEKLQYRDVPLPMSGADFYRHKKNLLNEMDEAIYAANSD